MTKFDDDFLERLRQTFNMEAEEHLREISSQVFELEKGPGQDEQKSIVEQVFREVHSLKGAARSVNLSDIEAVCQSLENVMALMKRGENKPEQGVFDALHQSTDVIEKMIFNPAEAQNSLEILQLIQQLDQIAAEGENAQDVFQLENAGVVHIEKNTEAVENVPQPQDQKSSEIADEQEQESSNDNDEEDLDEDDREFLKTLRQTFSSDAEEHIHIISDGLLQLEQESGGDERTAILETIFREVHSLKGASGSVRLPTITKICQQVESVLSALKKGNVAHSDTLFDNLHASVDMLGQLVAAANDAQPDTADDAIGELLKNLNEVLKGGSTKEQHSPKPEITTLKSQTPKSLPKEQGVERLDTNKVSTGADSTGRAVEKTAAKQSSPASVAPDAPKVKLAQAKTAPPKTIRVSNDKLDAILFQTEEMLAAKLTAGQHVVDLREILAEFDLWKKEWAKVSSDIYRMRRALKKRADASQNGVSPRLQLDKAFDFLQWNEQHSVKLKNKAQSLVKSAAHDYRTLGSMVDTLLEDTKKLLMLPFGTLTQIFPKQVRDISRALGKEADLVIKGQEVEIDKRILEEMKDPLIHLVRNCLDHGLEKPDMRKQFGKPAKGVITIAISQVDAGKVEILISDDGGGIDAEKVKQSAVRNGFLSEKEAEAMDEKETLMLIFKSQVSTSDIITDLSGRGLGMSIVREKVEKLGGFISIESALHVGSTFRIILPLTLARFRGILVEVGMQQFIIPTSNVERVLRCKRDGIKTVENRETISLNERAVSLVYLTEILEIRQSERRNEDIHHVPILLLSSGDFSIAFVVDAILNEQEVVVKTLGKQLLSVRNISGATVLGSGKVVPILNVPDLMKSAVTSSSSMKKTAPVAGKADTGRKSVLVAEDSITSRTLLRQILESAGYDVKTAVDGADAFTLLKEQPFDLLVSDVEMPRLDGFTLTRKIREDKKMAELPIVLVTSLGSREDRERGIDSGADAYIVKSSFDQSNLLAVCQRLL